MNRKHCCSLVITFPSRIAAVLKAISVAASQRKEEEEVSDSAGQ